MNAASRDELLFVALGGAGEIGMNMNLYGFGPPQDMRWMIVDCGVTFANGTVPGIDVLMADPAFIEERRENLEGLVLTHAHEDHLGAVQYLWDRLRCPVYATPFAASILRRKLPETGLEGKLKVNQIDLGGTFNVGPFAIEMISLTHSIPEPNALAIRTGAGLVLHTGDWRLDPGPVVGGTADEEALKRLGDDGVLAVVGDSTNVFNPTSSGSESDLLESLTDLIAGRENRVAIACFATNVARLKTVSQAARSNGRDVVLAGRSLRRIDEAARENGYLDGVPAFLAEEDAGHLPKDKSLIICTGSQGEPRSALARIAAGDHPRVSLDEGDVVIFSSKIIPGNEMNISALQNKLIGRGVEVITEYDRFVHVSGHPCRDEMRRMYEYVRPRVSIPVHGETRHLLEHARLADECGVAERVVAENGSMVRLFPGPAGIVDHVPTGRLALVGKRLVALDGDLVRRRNRALYNGTALVTVVLNGAGKPVSELRISTIGVFEEGEDCGLAIDAAGRAIAELPAKSRKDDETVSEAVRIAVRRVLREKFGRKPETIVHVVRV